MIIQTMVESLTNQFKERLHTLGPLGHGDLLRFLFPDTPPHTLRLIVPTDFESFYRGFDPHAGTFNTRIIPANANFTDAFRGVYFGPTTSYNANIPRLADAELRRQRQQRPQEEAFALILSGKHNESDVTQWQDTLSEQRFFEPRNGQLLLDSLLIAERGRTPDTVHLIDISKLFLQGKISRIIQALASFG